MGGAHVAVELVIDAVAMERGYRVDGFDAAMELGRSSSNIAFHWRSEDEHRRWLELHDRLPRAAADVPSHALIAQRVSHTLKRRPRLTMAEKDLPTLTAEVARLWREVEHRIDQLFADLREQLAAH
jgi:hypothetical protein